MKLHANAALSLNTRRLLCRRVVEQQWTRMKAAEAAEVSVSCARTWVTRYRAEGELGLLDRSWAPVTVANRTCERRVEAIAALRRLRFTGPEIAESLAMPLSTARGFWPGSEWAGWAGWAWRAPSATSVPGPAS